MVGSSEAVIFSPVIVVFLCIGEGEDLVGVGVVLGVAALVYNVQ